MKILALECSATPASVALLEDEKIIASAFSNVKLTHSQTLMPMVESVLNSSHTDISNIEGLCISAGPGSFTGVRIGISAIKGIAAPKNLPCVAVSTLQSMAQNYSDTDCIVCAVMDARCNQVYNAIFNLEKGNITRLTEDRAILCQDLLQNLKEIFQKTQKDVIIVGDGTDVFYEIAKELTFVKKSHPIRRYQNAVGVGFTALESFKMGNTILASEILPIYLRLPQAERELKSKEQLK